MKKGMLLLMLVGSLLYCGNAMAVPTTWTVSQTYAPEYIGWWDAKIFSLDVTDAGYIPGMEIDDFQLSVFLADDGGCFDGSEKAFLLAGTQSDGSWTMGSLNVGWSPLGELDLEDDGTLNFAVGSLFGDFFINSARLVVFGDSGTCPTAPVPEPATIMLLSAGLIGLMVSARKKKPL